MAVYAGVKLLERPTLRRHFVVGLFGGLMAFFGKNHGAYHVAAFVVLIAWAGRKQDLRGWAARYSTWAAGLLLGYLPQWLMLIFLPGYREEFFLGLGQIVSKGTNLGAKIPWPWLVPSDYPFWARCSLFAEGCFFVGVPLFFLTAVIAAVKLGRAKLRLHPVFIAATCVSFPYAHYIFSRPDSVHLGHGAPVVALGAIALIFALLQRPSYLGQVSVAIFVAASFLANLFQFSIAFKILSPPKTLLTVSVEGHRILVGKYTARVMASAQLLADELARPDESILFLPHMPGLYPFTHRLSPIKPIYLIFPASPEEDQALAEEIDLQQVQWVMLQDHALDDREDLRFRKTNPIVFQRLVETFELVPMESLPPDIVLLHRRAAGPGTIAEAAQP